MRTAGGVLALVVGVLQLIATTFVVIASGGSRQVMSVDADSGLTAAGQAAMGAAEAGAWLALLIGLAVFLLGILVLSSRTPRWPKLLLLVAVIAVVLAIVTGAGLLGLLWNGLTLLAGLLAFAGARQEARLPRR